MNTDTKYLIESYHLNDEVTWDQIDTLIPKYQLVDHIDYFLTNLKANHQLPGKIYEKLSGIGNWYREKEFVTPKQHRFATLTIIAYWYELENQYRYYI